MKANELRIGNKVSYEGSIVTVSTIADDEVTFSDYASFDYPQIEDISGIELTEEWLVRFGIKDGENFIKLKSGTLGEIKRNPNGWKIYLSGRFGLVYLDSVQYVHQLQNL